MLIAIHLVTDEDRQERKRVAMMMYEQFKNRSGPANPGSKVLPKVSDTIKLFLFKISNVASFRVNPLA